MSKLFIKSGLNVSAVCMPTHGDVELFSHPHFHHHHHLLPSPKETEDEMHTTLVNLKKINK